MVEHSFKTVAVVDGVEVQASPAVELLHDVARRLRLRGLSVELDGDALYAEQRGARLLVAQVTSRGQLRVHPHAVWDGHGHGPAGGLTASVHTPGSRADQAITICTLIRDRLAARADALATCVHRAHASGLCPECGELLPVAPVGTHEALRTAADEMARRGFRGSFRVQAMGAALRVIWCTSEGSRAATTDEALQVAVEHLRAGGLRADVVLSLGYALLSRVVAAEERTVLDSVRDEEPLPETERECELCEPMAAE